MNVNWRQHQEEDRGIHGNAPAAGPPPAHQQPHLPPLPPLTRATMRQTVPAQQLPSSNAVQQLYQSLQVQRPPLQRPGYPSSTGQGQRVGISETGQFLLQQTTVTQPQFPNNPSHQDNSQANHSGLVMSSATRLHNVSNFQQSPIHPDGISLRSSAVPQSQTLPTDIPTYLPSPYTDHHQVHNVNQVPNISRMNWSQQAMAQNFPQSTQGPSIRLNATETAQMQQFMAYLNILKGSNGQSHQLNPDQIAWMRQFSAHLNSLKRIQSQQTSSQGHEATRVRDQGQQAIPTRGQDSQAQHEAPKQPTGVFPGNGSAAYSQHVNQPSGSSAIGQRYTPQQWQQIQQQMCYPQINQRLETVNATDALSYKERPTVNLSYSHGQNANFQRELNQVQQSRQHINARSQLSPASQPSLSVPSFPASVNSLSNPNNVSIPQSGIRFPFNIPPGWNTQDAKKQTTSSTNEADDKQLLGQWYCQPTTEARTETTNSTANSLNVPSSTEIAVSAPQLSTITPTTSMSTSTITDASTAPSSTLRWLLSSSTAVTAQPASSIANVSEPEDIKPFSLFQAPKTVEPLERSATRQSTQQPVFVPPSTTPVSSDDSQKHQSSPSSTHTITSAVMNTETAYSNSTSSPASVFSTGSQRMSSIRVRIINGEQVLQPETVCSDNVSLVRSRSTSPGMFSCSSSKDLALTLEQRSRSVTPPRSCQDTTMTNSDKIIPHGFSFVSSGNNTALDLNSVPARDIPETAHACPAPVSVSAEQQETTVTHDKTFPKESVGTTDGRLALPPSSGLVSVKQEITEMDYAPLDVPISTVETQMDNKNASISESDSEASDDESDERFVRGRGRGRERGRGSGRGAKRSGLQVKFVPFKKSKSPSVKRLSIRKPTWLNKTVTETTSNNDASDEEQVSVLESGIADVETQSKGFKRQRDKDTDETEEDHHISKIACGMGGRGRGLRGRRGTSKGRGGSGWGQTKMFLGKGRGRGRGKSQGRDARGGSKVSGNKEIHTIVSSMKALLGEKDQIRAAKVKAALEQYSGDDEAKQIVHLLTKLKPDDFSEPGQKQSKDKPNERIGLETANGPSEFVPSSSDSNNQTTVSGLESSVETQGVSGIQESLEKSSSGSDLKNKFQVTPEKLHQAKLNMQKLRQKSEHQLMNTREPTCLSRDAKEQPKKLDSTTESQVVTTTPTRHQLVKVRFHGKKILMLLMPTGRYFVVWELFKRCFKRREDTSYSDIYVLKSKMKIPSIYLEEDWKPAVIKFYVDNGKASLVKCKSVYGIISLRDADCLYHKWHETPVCSKVEDYLEECVDNLAAPPPIPFVSDEVIDLCDSESDFDSDVTIPYVDGDPVVPVISGLARSQSIKTEDGSESEITTNPTEVSEETCLEGPFDSDANDPKVIRSCFEYILNQCKSLPYRRTSSEDVSSKVCSSIIVPKELMQPQEQKYFTNSQERNIFSDLSKKVPVSDEDTGNKVSLPDRNAFSISFTERNLFSISLGSPALMTGTLTNAESSSTVQGQTNSDTVLIQHYLKGGHEEACKNDKSSGSEKCADIELLGSEESVDREYHITQESCSNHSVVNGENDACCIIIDSDDEGDSPPTPQFISGVSQVECKTEITADDVSYGVQDGRLTVDTNHDAGNPSGADSELKANTRHVQLEDTSLAEVMEVDGQDEVESITASVEEELFADNEEPSADDGRVTSVDTDKLITADESTHPVSSSDGKPSNCNEVLENVNAGDTIKASTAHSETRQAINPTVDPRIESVVDCEGISSGSQDHAAVGSQREASPGAAEEPGSGPLVDTDVSAGNKSAVGLEKGNELGISEPSSAEGTLEPAVADNQDSLSSDVGEPGLPNPVLQTTGGPRSNLISISEVPELEDLLDDQRLAGSGLTDEEKADIWIKAAQEIFNNNTGTAEADMIEAAEKMMFKSSTAFLTLFQLEERMMDVSSSLQEETKMLLSQQKWDVGSDDLAEVPMESTEPDHR